MDSSELKNSLNDLKIRLDDIKDGVFDINSKEKRLKEIESELSKEEIWSDLDLSQKISKEKTALEKTLNSFKSVEEKVTDGLMFIDIAELLYTFTETDDTRDSSYYPWMIPSTKYLLILYHINNHFKKHAICF